MVLEKPADEELGIAAAVRLDALDNAVDGHDINRLVRALASKHGLEKQPADLQRFRRLVLVLGHKLFEQLVAPACIFLVVGDHRQAERSRDRRAVLIRASERGLGLLDLSVQPVEACGILFVLLVRAIGSLRDVPL